MFGNLFGSARTPPTNNTNTNTSVSPSRGNVNKNNTNIKRIMADARDMKKHPSSRYTAEPLEENLFEWHFTIRGTPGSDFDGGIYHGRIILPPEYPQKPPNFVFMTPNGRFEVGVKICLSISGHHEETWQPVWTIRTMLEALVSFMPSEGNGAIGALDWTKEERQKLAKESQSFVCSECGPIRDLLRDPEGNLKEGGEVSTENGDDNEGDLSNEKERVRPSTLTRHDSVCDEETKKMIEGTVFEKVEDVAQDLASIKEMSMKDDKKEKKDKDTLSEGSDVSLKSVSSISSMDNEAVQVESSLSKAGKGNAPKNDTINDEAGVDVQTSTGTSGTVATDTVATNMNANDNTSNVTAVSPTSLSADPPDGTTSTAPTNHKAPYWTETPPSVKAVRRRILGQRKTDIDAQRDENGTITDTNAATTNATTSMSTSSNRRTLSDVGLQSALSSTDSTLFHSTSTHANGQNEEALEETQEQPRLLNTPSVQAVRRRILGQRHAHDDHGAPSDENAASVSENSTAAPESMLHATAVAHNEVPVAVAQAVRRERIPPNNNNHGPALRMHRVNMQQINVREVNTENRVRKDVVDLILELALVLTGISIWLLSSIQLIRTVDKYDASFK